MRRVTIVVIGNGKSTRANVEALINDVAESVDQATIATVYDTKPSEGQVWAEQWAKDKEIPVLTYEENNFNALGAENALDELRFFILWDDEDPDCQLASSYAQEWNVPAYDLTDGLMLINLDRSTIVKPQEIPEDEKNVEPLPEEVELSAPMSAISAARNFNVEEWELRLPDEDEDEEEEEEIVEVTAQEAILGATLSDLLDQISTLLAEKLAEKLRDNLK